MFDFQYLFMYENRMAESKKPPRLKLPKVMISLTVSKETRGLLRKAAKATGLSQGEYVELALKPLFEEHGLK